MGLWGCDRMSVGADTRHVKVQGFFFQKVFTRSRNGLLLSAPLGNRHRSIYHLRNLIEAVGMELGGPSPYSVRLQSIPGVQHRSK
jgi:hypothetical protein